MKIIYTYEKPPESYRKSIFLAGPTPRSKNVKSWRPEAIQMLRDKGYDGVVYLPEYKDESYEDGEYIDQVDWERDCLNLADIIVFWVPRDLEDMPAFTTNVEFGTWLDSGKIVFGAPPEAPKNSYLEWLGNTRDIKREDTLEAVLDNVISLLGKGSERADGERYVPLHIWQTPQFQDWYKSQLSAGNRLDKAEQKFIFKLKGKVFSYILWAKIWIASEDRYKENEFVFSRSDISTVLLYYKPRQTEKFPYDAMIVLVKEFRVPARTPDGYIYELPGGSDLEINNPLRTAANEVKEEVGLDIDLNRFNIVDSRQLAGTLSSHFARLFSVELTEEEFNEVKDKVQDNEVHGLEEDSERTYIRLYRVSDLLDSDVKAKLDWSMLGMIFVALQKQSPID